MNVNDSLNDREKIEVGKEVRTMRSVFLKIIGISMIPLIVMAIVVAILENIYFRNIIKDEIKEELRTSAYGLSALYDNASPGDYEMRDDGTVYKGSKKVTGLFDTLSPDLKKSGIAFTFFYGNTRIDTSVYDVNGKNMAGTKLDNDKYRQIYDSGEELFCEATDLGGRTYYGYYVPYKNSNGELAAIFFAGRLQNEVFANAGNYTYMILWTVFIILIIGTIVSLLCTIYTVGVMFRHFKREQEMNIKMIACKNQTEFMTLVDREVRDPIDNITVLSDKILDEETSPEIREQVLGIKESCNSMLISFRSIRDYSLLESDEIDDNTDEYEIIKIVDDSCKKVAAGIERKHLDFRVNYDESMSNHLKGDYVKIRQILDNLLENAVKYTYEGSVVLDISYRKITPGKIDVTFTITDTGVGIRREDAQKLFNSIGKVGDNKNVSIKGTGLGLLICKRLVNLLDGRISAESEIGKGSIFTFTIPQDVAGERTVGESLHHDN